MNDGGGIVERTDDRGDSHETAKRLTSAARGRQ